MKTINKFRIVITTLVLAILVMPSSSFAQVNLKGKWEVSCAFEKLDESSMSFCHICPTEKKSESSVAIKGLDFIFSNDSLTIITDNEKKGTTVACNILNILQILKFTYEGKDYSFRILITDSEEKIYILKEESTGSLLLMEKD